MPEEHLPAVVVPEPTPLLLIQQGIDAKISPRDMKDLFDLQVRYEQRLAEQAYADAITAFQADCPPIRKNATNPHSKKSYADYEGVMRTITPLLRKHKIVITFDTAESDGKMTTTCRVRVGTVEKTTTITLPVDAASKMMNATQAGGAAMSYGRRYALAAALNLIYTDEDTDALPADSCITDAELAELRRALVAAGQEPGPFLDWASHAAGFAVEHLEQLPGRLYQQAIGFLKRKAAKKSAEKAAKQEGGAA